MNDHSEASHADASPPDAAAINEFHIKAELERLEADEELQRRIGNIAAAALTTPVSVPPSKPANTPPSQPGMAAERAKRGKGGASR
ncbi:hypothetical protein [Streptomyces sp. NPDC058394]|uniref:hypothetical protein n=1 Tax=Streptomyces sp. NPDC058394 TaxID=3346477 RepID=UPI0036623A95